MVYVLMDARSKTAFGFGIRKSNFPEGRVDEEG